MYPGHTVERDTERLVTGGRGLASELVQLGDSHHVAADDGVPELAARQLRDVARDGGDFSVGS